MAALTDVSLPTSSSIDFRMKEYLDMIASPFEVKGLMVQ